MTNGRGKSDRPVVPEKSPNKAGNPVAEGMEGRGLAKGNLPQQHASWTPSRTDASSALERVRQAAGKDKKLRFTALLHHIYNLETLRMAYFSLKKEAAPGVDGETWRHYGEELERNLQDLSDRLKRGAYRAKPVRRVYIPKADGRQRPLGVPALEDKIVQRAAVEVLNAIYETDFLGFSYGFRPGRSQHQALDALYTGLLTRKVNWVLDLDIKGFFDGISHEWLVKFVEHRIADRRVVRLIQKWLRAGVLENAKRIPTGVAGRREAEDVQLPGLYAHLREEEEQWAVHGVAANDSQKVADEAERGESRTSATHARTHPRSRQVVASGGAWTHPVLRSALEPQRAVDLSVPSGAALASRAVAAQPEWPRPVGPHAAPQHSLAASAFGLSPLSPAPHRRHPLRQEPDAGIPLVRIRGGGCVQT